MMLLHKSTRTKECNIRSLPSSKQSKGDLSSDRYLFYWSRPLGESPHYFRMIVKPKHQRNFGNNYWAIAITLPELLTKIRQSSVDTLEVSWYPSPEDAFIPAWDVIVAELQRSCTRIRTLLVPSWDSSRMHDAAGLALLISSVGRSVHVVQLGAPSARPLVSMLRNGEHKLYEPLWTALKDCVLLKELCIFNGPPLVETSSSSEIASSHAEFFRTILPRLHSLQLHNILLCRQNFQKMIQCVEQFSVIPRLEHVQIYCPGTKSDAPLPSNTIYSESYMQFIIELHSWRWKILEQREDASKKYLQKPRSLQYDASIHDDFGHLLDATVMIIRDWYREATPWNDGTSRFG